MTDPEIPESDETPTDEQMREWFPRLFAQIDEELKEIEEEGL